MEGRRRKKLYHWFCILAAAIALSGCGRPEHGASDALAVSLELPAGESELFWYGVSSRKISVLRDGKVIQETAWASGRNLDCELEEGDELRFTGFDDDGRPLVDGSARVGPEKKASIPLRRLL